MAKKDPQDPVVPGEKTGKARCPSIPLNPELAEYTRQIAGATGMSHRDLIALISESEEFKVAVRQVCSAAVDEHVRQVNELIGFKLNQPAEKAAGSGE